MESLFETTTKYTYEEYRKFNFALLKKKHVLPLIILAEILILVGGILSQNEFLIIFAVLYPFVFIWSLFHGIKNVYHSNKVTQDKDIHFKFYEDHFEEEHDSGNANITYDKLNEIIETKTNFYLMIAKNQGFMILKENMPEGLEEFIKNIKISKTK